MLPTTACGSPSLSSPWGPEGEKAFGHIGQLGVDRGHPGEELSGQGDVAGPFVEIGQDVPLAEMSVTGIAEVLGRTGGGEDHDGFVELAQLRQGLGQDEPAFDENVGRR